MSQQNEKIAVLLGGAWSRGHEPYWMQYVREWWEKRGYRVIILPYTIDGKTHPELVQYCIWQLRNNGVLSEENEVVTPVTGVAYSMGGDILHLIAERVPGLFHCVVNLASTNRFGMCVPGIVRGVATVPEEFFGGLLSWKGVALSDVERTRKLMFNDMSLDAGTVAVNELLPHCNTEPPACVLSLLPPMHLLNRATKPLQCPVVAIRPRQDVMFRDITYPGENVDIVDVEGGHGFILQPELCFTALEAATESPNWVE